MAPVRAKPAAVKHGGGARKSSATTGGSDRGRMVHIRLDPELHRKLRLVVAAEDTTLQEWITRTLDDAAGKAWSKVAEGAGR